MMPMEIDLSSMKDSFKNFMTTIGVENAEHEKIFEKLEKKYKEITSLNTRLQLNKECINALKKRCAETIETEFEAKKDEIDIENQVSYFVMSFANGCLNNADEFEKEFNLMTPFLDQETSKPLALDYEDRLSFMQEIEKEIKENIRGIVEDKNPQTIKNMIENLQNIQISQMKKLNLIWQSIFKSFEEEFQTISSSCIERIGLQEYKSAELEEKLNEIENKKLIKQNELNKSKELEMEKKRQMKAYYLSQCNKLDEEVKIVQRNQKIQKLTSSKILDNGKVTWDILKIANESKLDITSTQSLIAEYKSLNGFGINSINIDINLNDLLKKKYNDEDIKRIIEELLKNNSPATTAQQISFKFKTGRDLKSDLMHKYLLDNLAKFRNLFEIVLDFEDDIYSFSDACMGKIANSLKVMVGLKKLSLYFRNNFLFINNVGDEGFGKITEVLSSLDQLEDLKICFKNGKNRLTELALNKLAEDLGSSTRLTNFELNFNGEFIQTSDAAVEYLINQFKTKPSLKTVRLAFKNCKRKLIQIDEKKMKNYFADLKKSYTNIKIELEIERRSTPFTNY